MEQLSSEARLKARRRRYRLHYKVRKAWFRLNTSNRTVYLSAKTDNKHVLILHRDFNYSLQTVIE